MSKFKEVYQIDVNEFVEKKNGLSYLSWATAWKAFMEVYPDATYEIIKDAQGKCWFGDDTHGYMVYTKVTAGGITHEMWLPVMDNRNKSVLCPDSFVVNKTVMRCLTKNLAMFGLGLYIYQGEDLPQDDQPLEPAPLKLQRANELYTFAESIGYHRDDVDGGAKKYYHKTLDKMTDKEIAELRSKMEAAKKGA